jgi:peptide-methionine (S)-S-oxide reductase
MKKIVFSLLTILTFQSCTSASVVEPKKVQPKEKHTKDLTKLQTAYFASGCFWCVEGIYEYTKGVEEVVSGYSGGEEVNPTYELVSSGRTRHAETVKVYYDSSEISYQDLLRVFFSSHNPTTIDSQGPDSGPQYRSVIFYQNETEKKLANEYIQKLLKDKTFPIIVTEVIPLVKFYDAEIYHQDYERLNPNSSYIQGVSIPRLERYKAKEPDLLKKEE